MQTLNPPATKYSTVSPSLQPLHRAVLVLRYVDGLPVPQVAAVIGRGLTGNQLAARPRPGRAAPDRFESDPR